MRNYEAHRWILEARPQTASVKGDLDVLRSELNQESDIAANGRLEDEEESIAYRRRSMTTSA